MQHHEYKDLNGFSIRISRAAAIAASKGMLVITSAGNEANKTWHYITAPADADSILTVGAVDEKGLAASFSGQGPTSDGRIKPDVMAIGFGTVMADIGGGVKTGNGTSLAAPIITGLSACLWQANSNSTVMELINTIKKSAGHYDHPDNIYGYGVPDFYLANLLLKKNQPDNYRENYTELYPNPVNNELVILFSNQVNTDIDICMYDLTGRRVFHNIYPASQGREYLKLNKVLNLLHNGVYILSIKTASFAGISKVLKY